MAYNYTYRTGHFDFLVGGLADQQNVLMPDSRRVSIIFDLSQGGIINFHFEQMAFLSKGAISTFVNSPIVLLWKDHAELVRGEWWAVANAAGSILNVTEVLALS